MVAWEPCTTAFPQGFTALRLEANRLSWLASERMAHVGSEAQRACTGNAGQLLCRALRLAPACYRQFSLAAQPRKGPRMQLEIRDNLLDEPGGYGHEYSATDFDSVAGLAAAMGQFAPGEGLSVQLSPDASCVIVRRIGVELPGGAAEVQ